MLFCALFCSTGCGDKLDPGIVEASGAASTGSETGSTTTSTGSSTTGSGTSGTSTTGTSGTSGSTGTTSAAVCGTGNTTIGYLSYAKATIANNCALSSCHGGGTSPSMSDYASTKSAIQGGGLTAINNGSMPPSGGLSADDSCIIQTWAQQGYVD